MFDTAHNDLTTLIQTILITSLGLSYCSLVGIWKIFTLVVAGKYVLFAAEQNVFAVATRMATSSLNNGSTACPQTAPLCGG